MRILLVHDYGTLHGGAEIMAVELRAALRGRGHEARLFTSDARPLPLAILADDRCFGSMGTARKLLQVTNPLAVRSLRGVLRQFRPDVVHLRMFMTQLSPAILPVLRAVPTVLHVVNHDLVCPLTTRVLPDGSRCGRLPGVACGQEGCVGAAGVARTVVQQALLRRGLRSVSVVVANSAATRTVLESVGLRVDAVIWNGVPPFDARPPLQGPPVAMVAGRLVREKGVDVLLRAMPAVCARIPGARLRIAGEGPERPALERMSHELGLDAAVEFVGHLPHARMESLAAEAWVQVVPSRWDEPFGIVAAEAMMRGTAVVASDSGGLSEIVHEELTGLRVPPGDAGRLAEALVRVLSDRSLAERLGGAGRTFALAELTQARMVDRFVDLYASLLGRAPPAHVRG